MRFVTIVAKNYLPAARVLARSVLVHEAERLTVVVVDLMPGEQVIDPDVNIVNPGALPIPVGELSRMAVMYSVTELSTALKPFALRWLLDQGATQACYLDPDMVLYAPLHGLREQLADAVVVLTPHVLQPLPRDGRETSEYTLRRCGIFNLGFLAVSSAGVPFLDWFAERLLRDAISDPVEMLYTDQKWADWVPALFSCSVWRDPGVNVAYWNLHERNLRWLGDEYRCGDQPLRVFHFSGFDPSEPTTFTSRPGANYRLEQAPAVVERLCAAYAADLAEAGAGMARLQQYGYASTPCGYWLSASLRRHTRNETIAREAAGGSGPESPFTDEQAFLRWLAEPLELAGGVNSPRALVVAFTADGGVTLGGSPQLAWKSWTNTDSCRAEIERYDAAALSLSLPRLTVTTRASRQSASAAVGVLTRIMRRARRLTTRVARRP